MSVEERSGRSDLFFLFVAIHKMTERTLAASPHHESETRSRFPEETSEATENGWSATPEWIQSWKSKLPLQTITRLLQVLVPQVEKICTDRGLTDESEIIKFLQHGTLVGLLPVPHPILIRKYQPNSGTVIWFRTYMWGVIYLRYGTLDPSLRNDSSRFF